MGLQERKELSYPVSSANFRWIREKGLVYVDKTAYIHRLLEHNGKYYFIARPRRFGKSLFLDTLKEYFSGERLLFKGLEIDRLQPGDWDSYPIFRFDLSGSAYLREEDLEHYLHDRLAIYEKDWGLENSNPAANVGLRFEHLIHNVSKAAGRPVVILIDEYDSPLAATVDRPELHNLFQELLHGFYSVLKKMEEQIYFCFLTGVTRYGKVSVFSGLNNLKDLTFDNRYAGLCGVTEEELHRFYGAGVCEFAEKTGVSAEEMYSTLKFHYDGYHFTESLLDVYNPYSLNHVLDEQKIKGYWCESGTPILFLKMLMDMDYNIEKLQGARVNEKILSNLSLFSKNPIPLFFQTGYLTLKDYDPESQTFTLGYPNREVETGILNNLLEAYNPDGDYASQVLFNMAMSLREGKPEEFVGCLKTYFADIPSDLKERVARYENYYHTVIYCLLTLLGLETKAEYGVAAGYIDLVVKTEKYVYVIELKLNGSALEAMKQIEKKDYCGPFALDSRRVVKIGLGFSKESRNISDYIIS